MRVVTSPNQTSSVLRPTAYLGIDGSWPEGDERIIGELKVIPKGTLFLPNTEESDVGWRYRAAWDANIVAFWFPKGNIDQSGKLIELGLQIGRYAAGYGSNSLIIGAHQGSPVREHIERILVPANEHFQDRWKLRVVTNFHDYVKKVKSAIG